MPVKKYDLRFAKVKVNQKTNSVLVPVSSEQKPAISELVVNKWQKILDLIVELVEIPCSLIMKLDSSEIEVFLKSQNEENPYKESEKANLNTGLFCETVVGNRDKLIVPNALDDENWKDNPDVALNMISYLGFPIEWPDKEIFGTICVLDSKTNHYSAKIENLIMHLKLSIENDLELLTEKRNLEDILSKKELLIRDIHHRIKNNFNTLINFLNLKNIENDEEIFNELINEITSRIQTISKIHQNLYIKEDYEKINLKDYFDQLINELIKLYKTNDVQFHFISKDLLLNFNQAIMVGMVVGELTTNSLKYAFDKIDHPEITLKITDSENKFLNIVYSDNGPGINEQFRKSELSFGTNLVETLVKQLNGKLKIESSEKGLSYDVLIPYT